MGGTSHGVCVNLLPLRLTLGVQSAVLTVGREGGCKVTETGDKLELHLSLNLSQAPILMMQDNLQDKQEPSPGSCTCTCPRIWKGWRRRCGELEKLWASHCHMPFRWVSTSGMSCTSYNRACPTRTFQGLKIIFLRQWLHFRLLNLMQIYLWATLNWKQTGEGILGNKAAAQLRFQGKSHPSLQVESPVWWLHHLGPGPTYISQPNCFQHAKEVVFLSF